MERNGRLGRIVLAVAAILLLTLQAQTVLARSPGSGLWVTAVIPKGAAGTPFNTIEIRFSGPVQAGSFTSEDVQLTGFTAGTPVQLAPEAYEVSFTPSTGPAVYSLTIGPNILDSAGQAMDQDGDGIRGEGAADAYRGALFSTSATINAGDTTYDGQYLVITNSTITINGPHAFGGVGVYGTGVITHSAATADSVYKQELNINDGLYVESTSKIDVTGKGYLAGRTVGNVTTGAAQDLSGGTYGGEGFMPTASTGPTNRAYGDYRNPTEPGSGGGLHLTWGAGSGGGVVKITADSATINGSILSNGGNGGISADPAGSGGSIRMDVGTLSGAGIIAANGGNGYVTGGSGGGGRVAIYYGDMSGFSPANVQSHGGKGAGNAGGAGSVYLKPASGMGTLRIDTHITASDTTPRALTPLGVPGDTAFEVERLVVAGRYAVAVPERAGLAIQAGEIVIESGGALSHRAATATEVFTLELSTGTLTIDAHSESRIDGSAKGYLAGRTLGNETTGAAQDLAGGTYGGEGFVPTASTGPTNRAYGDYRNPSEPGSGGGLHLTWGAGSGGGVLKITASSATINGSILSNGGGGAYSADPAGSGGSIWMDVGTLSGAGIIAANGGNGYVSGGSGGGGRIAIYYEDISGFSPANVQSHGGKGAGNAGGAGSVYLKPASGMGTLRIDTHITASDTTPRALTPLGIPGDTLFQVERLVVAGKYSVAVPERAGLPIQADEVVIESGGALSHRAATATEVFTLELSTGSLTIDSNAESRIDVSGKGYLAGRTVGNTTVGGAQSRAGATFGGEGFAPAGYGPTNRAYGNYTDPNLPGSGGGLYYGNAGSGGGVIRITVGSAEINGSILANGQNGFYAGDPAGSGGSIRMDVGTLSGAGVVSANGGNGYGQGGSGGGGRIAVYHQDMSGFPLANVRAHGGSGGTGAGGVGSVYLKTPDGAGILRIDNHGSTVGALMPLGNPGDTSFVADHLVIAGTGTIVAPEHNMPIVANKVSLENGGVLTHRAASASEVFTLDIEAAELVIDATSRIDVTGKGYLVGRTAGNTTLGGAKSRAGGTYGGEGFVPTGYGPTNRVYGNYREPDDPGSGGGPFYVNAGSGGGVIRIAVNAATIDGSILANGQNGFYAGDPAGSGGSVRMDVGSLSGAGIIAANGGNGYGQGGSGGGGRVAIYYEDMSGFILANVQSHGGKGAGNAGGAGSVYLNPSSGMGTLRIDTHITSSDATPRALTPLGIPSDMTFQVGRLVIAGRYSVAVPERAGLPIQADEIVIESGGALSHRAATATEGFTLEVNTGTLTIDSNSESRIDVTGKGYLVGRTDGNTVAGGATGTSGGSYGGLGFGTQSNDTYGDPLYPYKPGSGGGTNWTSGGAGGGVAHIYAQGITVEGSIKANGGDGFFSGDTAGSGGSILITAVTLSGSGSVSANGGKGYGSGGSGGGGRIAVYLRGDMTLPQANITAAGGTGGSGPGQGGTVRMPDEPVFLWMEQDQGLFHDVETLEWIALGLDPAEGILVDVVVQGVDQSFSLASALPGTGALQWDTTKIPDGVYQLDAVFKNSSSEILGEASRTILVNNSVVWHSGDVLSNETWVADRMHFVESDLSIGSGKTVTVEAGAIVKFAPGSRLVIQPGAVLAGTGTVSSPILFTSLADDEAGGDTNLDGTDSKPQPGDWSGLSVQGDGQLSLSGTVEIRYSMHEHEGTLAADETWPGKFLHHVTGAVTVPNGITLTIEPGAVVKFKRALGIIVQPGGRLLAQGSTAQPINFTSSLDDSIGGDTNRDGNASSPGPGDWKGIHALGGQADLKHIMVNYAGGTDNGSWNNAAGAVVVQNGGTVTVSNSLLRDAFFEGIIAWGSGTVSAENTVIGDADRGVNADGTASVSLKNCTLDNNRIGIWGHGGSLEITNTIISHSSEAGIDNILNSPIAISYSNVWSEAGANYVRMADQTGTNGSISADPLYKNAPAGNYRLRFLSPMIDAADGTVAPETDFMGAPRYDDPRSENTGVAAASEAFADMGAFEFVESAQSDVDLVVTAVSLPAEPGNPVMVNWQVRNQGVGTARLSWVDALYLSSDKLWTPDDILLATQLHSGDVGPGQSYSNSGEALLPQARPGNYYVLVRTNYQQDLFEGVNQYNNVGASSATVLVDLPSFIPGGSVTGNLLQAGDVQYFELLVPAKQNLSIELSGPQGSVAGLYVRRGELPTLQDFQWRSVIAGSADQYLSLNDATPGSYFVMVTASSLSVAGDFNLLARTSEFSIRGVRPQKGGNGGKVTITIDGALFDRSTTARLIDSAGKPVEGDPVYFVNSGVIAATFDLSGCALGMADVQVITGQSAPTTLAGGFEIVSSIPGTLSANIDAPSAVRVGRDFNLYVDYRNVGLQDLVAPILRLKMPSWIAAVGLSPQMEDAVSDLWMVAVNPEVPAGILPPGASGRITVYGRSTVGGNILYSLDLSVYDSQQIDWAALKSSLKPADMSETEWNLLFTQIQGIVGQDWEDYGRVVSDAANLLTPLRGATSSLNEIFQLIVDQATAVLKPSVSGYAFLGDGDHPLSNARITLWDQNTDTLLSAVTLHDGSYLFPDVPTGSYGLEAEGYFLGQTITVSVGTGDVVVPDFIATEQEFVIAGKVFTLPDGMPVPDQLVAVIEEAGAAYTTVTDEDGSYRVEGLPAGTFAIKAFHEFLGRAEVSGIRLEPGKEIQRVNLGLSTGSSISGTLSGYAGDFPEASSVYAVDQGGRVRGVGDVAPSGAYSITGLMEGIYDLYTNVPGVVRQRVQGVTVGPQSFVTGIDIALTAAGAVEGTLSASGGAPLPYQFVTVMAGETFYAGGITDGDGHFAMTGLAPGIYSVRARVIGYLPAEGSVMFAAGGTATVDLVLSQAAVISGTVVDGEGNPLIGAVVGVRGSDGNEIWAVTDDTGSYEMGDLLPGTYNVYVGNPDSGATTGEVMVVAESGTPAQADFTVQVAGKITGTVMESDGTTPLAEATVQLFKDGLPVGSTATDEAGVYELQLLTSGSFSVAAFAPGKSFALAGDLFVGEGSETVEWDFTAGTQSQAGQVLSEQTGKPVPEASLFIYQELFPGVYELVHEIVSDSQGSFSVAGLAPGNYLAVAEKAGSAFAEAEFTVAQPLVRAPLNNDPPGSISLNMGPSSSVGGQILNKSGKPIAGAEVMITYPDADRVLASAAADEGGNYSIPGLPAGSFDAIVSADGHEFSRTTLIVTPGESVNLNGELNPSKAGVSGQVTAGGRPVPHAVIVARDNKKRPLELRVTGKDGAFDLNRLVPGEYGMMITSEGNTPTTGTIDLPPDVIISHREELVRAANDPNSRWNQFVREFDKNVEWLRNLGPRGIEWVYETAYKVEKDKRHPTIVPDAALDYCKPHRAYAVRMTQWADEQFKLWQGAQINSMSLVNNAERVCQWLILGKEVALVFIPLAEKLTKLDKTLKTMKRLRNVQRWYSMSQRFEQGSKLAQRVNNLNNFIKGLSAIYDRLSQPVPKDPAARRSQADGFLADMNDLAGIATGHASEWAETAKWVKQFEQELKLAGQATSEVLFVLGELSGILSIAMQAETAWNEWFEIGKNIASSRKNYEDRYKEYLGAVNKAYNAIILLQLCNKGIRIPPPKPPRTSPIRTGSLASNQAIDPNEKTGPAAWGSEGFVQSGSLTYRIDFENDPEFATAPAQEVFVTDELDQNLDLNTFQFLSFGFSNRVFEIPAGLSRYRTTVDLRPGNNLVVDVFLILDPQTRKISATFRSLDPQTLRLTEDPFAGFLPVNNAQHDGEGFVEFSIRTRSDLGTGTEIRNQAAIVFDVNDPIVTNEVRHTLDSTGPISGIGALPSWVSSRMIPLNLGGSDAAGSGIQFYDIYVSDNGGPYTYWLTTSETSVVFWGECGHVYAFYSVALDYVGNMEEPPALPDVVTEVLSIPGDTDGSGDVDLADMILTLQNMNKRDGTDLVSNLCAEVNGDGRIGMEEVIYILQSVSELR